MEGALKNNTSFCSRREKRRKKMNLDLKLVKENYMKFDQFFVRFARDEIGWSTKCIQLY